MASGRQRVTMSIYPEDKEFIRMSTLNYPNIETGGDMFGLWQSESEVVVQFVTGPGENCRRTQTAFFQDKTYLSEVGGYLTTAKGLCNIGEWHSHHRLNLPEPSAGDRATVWRNMPGCGLKRFLLIIATIAPTGQVEINGFMFTAPESGRRNGRMEPVQTRALNGLHPFRNHHEVLAKLSEGAEAPSVGPSVALSSAPSRYIPETLDENDGSQQPRRRSFRLFKRNQSKKYEISETNKENKQKKEKGKKKRFRFRGKKKGNYRRVQDGGGISSDPTPAPDVSTPSSNNIDDHYNQYGQTTPQPALTQQRSEFNPQAHRSSAQIIGYQKTSNV